MPALRSELEFIIQALFAYIRTIGGNLQNRTTQADNSMSSIKSMDSLMMSSIHKKPLNELTEAEQLRLYAQYWGKNENEADVREEFKQLTN